MRVARAKLILAGAGATLGICAAFATGASAAVAISQSESPDPVPQGGNVTSTILVSNPGAAVTGVQLQLGLTRAGQAAGAKDSYLSITPSVGSCTVSGTGNAGACSLGDMAPGAVVGITAVIKTNESFDQTVRAFRCFDAVCDFPEELGVSVGTAHVIIPPVISGSSKIKVNGLPSSCTSSKFTAKAKAKGAITRFYAYLSGPRNEFGTSLPSGSNSKRIKKGTKKKLAVPIKADTLSPGFYELKLTAKPKQGKAATTFVQFQVCGDFVG